MAIPIFLALTLPLKRGDLFAAQAPVNWQADWEATQRAAEKEAKLVTYDPPGADQQKLYTEVFQHPFAKTMADEQFRAEVKKRNHEFDPVVGEELERLAKQIIGQPPDVIERLKKVFGNL